MARKLILSGLMLCAWPAGPGVAQSADTLVLSLSRAETLALDNHPFVSRARADLQLAEARRTQARHSRWAPELQLSNFWGPIPDARGVVTDDGILVSPDSTSGVNNLGWFTQASLELVQPLYTFGRIDRLVNAANAGVEASEAGVEATSDEIRLQVRKVYWAMVLGEALVDIADEILREIAEADVQLQERYEDGSVSQNDLFEFEIYRFRAQKGRREAIDGLEMARAALRAATGVSDGVPIQAETRELTLLDVSLDSLDGYLQLAREARPELAQLRAGIAAQSSLARARRSEYYPQLFLAGKVEWNHAPGRFDPKNPFIYNPTNFFRPGVVVGFNWNVNLFQTRDRVRIAEREAAKLSAQMDPLGEKVQLDVREAYMGLVRAAADVEDSERALTAADNWFRAESQTFDLGLGEVQDLVDAFQAKIDMEREHLQSIFQFNTTLADLSRAVGRDLYPN
jgi:outer membrane protein TolC